MIWTVRLRTGRVVTLPANVSRAFRAGALIASVAVVDWAVIGSAGEGAIEGHFNAGYTVGGASRQLALAGAAEATVGDRVTFSGETLIRRIDGLRGILDVAVPHPSITGVDTLRLLPAGGSTTTMQPFSARDALKTRGSRSDRAERSAAAPQ